MSSLCLPINNLHKDFKVRLNFSYWIPEGFSYHFFIKRFPRHFPYSHLTTLHEDTRFTTQEKEWRANGINAKDQKSCGANFIAHPTIHIISILYLYRKRRLVTIKGKDATLSVMFVYARTLADTAYMCLFSFPLWFLSIQRFLRTGVGAIVRVVRVSLAFEVQKGNWKTKLIDNETHIGLLFWFVWYIIYQTTPIPRLLVHSFLKCDRKW